MPSDRPQGSQRRKRTKFNKKQHQILVEAFEKDQYPDIVARENLARHIQVPEPRIQVWFQNRRARVPKGSKRMPSGEADAPSPESLQGGPCAPDRPSHQGLLPASDAGVTPPSCALQAQDVGPAVFRGCSSAPGVGVAASEASGSFHVAPSSGSSAAVLAPALALPQPQAGSLGPHQGDPGPALTCGGWALPGWGWQPPSGDQQPWDDWESPPALQSAMVPQQLGAWEQLPPALPPSAQEHWLHPEDPHSLWLPTGPAGVSVGHQGPVGVPVGHQGPAGVPVGHQELMEVPVGHQGPMEVPVGHQGPVGVPIGHQGPVGMSVGHQELMEVPVGHQGPMGVPVGHQGPVGVSVGHQELMEVPVGHQGPVGVPVGQQGPVGVPVGHQGPVGVPVGYQQQLLGQPSWDGILG